MSRATTAGSFCVKLRLKRDGASFLAMTYGMAVLIGRTLAGVASAVSPSMAYTYVGAINPGGAAFFSVK